MMVIFGSLSGVYIIPTIYEDYSDLEHVATGKASPTSSVGDSDGPGQVAVADEFARNAVSSVYHRAKELKANSSVVSFCPLFLFL